MPTYTIYSDTTNGYMYASSQSIGGQSYVGMDTSNKYQIGLAFDTSVVVGNILSVTLSIYGVTSTPGPGFDIEARLHDWGATLTNADWVTGASLAAKTLLASRPTSGYVTGGFNAFTSDAAFATNINRSGTTRLILTSSRQRTGATPSGVEYVSCYPVQQGASFAPKLVIVTQTPVDRPIAGQAGLAITTAGAATSDYADFSGESTFAAYSRRTPGAVWAPLTVALPYALYNLSAAAVDGSLYVMGGRRESGLYMASVDAYDPTLNVWTSKAALPVPSYGGGATAVDGYIYYVGGAGSAGQYTTLWRYDPTANTWTTLAAVPLAGVSVAVGDPINGRLYCAANGSTTLCIYDITAGTWSTATMPSFVIGLNGTFHSNGKAYFRGQQTQNAPGNFYEYDPATGTFTAKAGSPDRSNFVMFSYDDKVWLVGGQANNIYTFVESTISWDSVTNTWTARDDLTVHRVAAAGAVVDDHPIIAGGFYRILDPFSFNYLASAERYGPVLESECEFSLPLELYPMKVANAALTINPTIDSAVITVDPRRLNPGFMKVGHRPFGYVDPTYWAQAGLPIPLPALNDPDVYVGGGSQTVAPTQIDEYAYVSDGQHFYLISGYWSGGDWDQWWSNRIYRFDAVTETWTELAHLPGYVGSEGCTAGLIDGKIYVVMGDTDDPPFGAASDFPDPEFDEADTYMLQSLWIYDIATDAWERGPQPPWVTTYSGSAVLDGKFYLVQMYGPGWDETPGFAVFDPVVDTWTVLTDEPFIPYDSPAVWAGDGKVWVANEDDVTGDAYIAAYEPGTGWVDETANFTGLVSFTAAAVVPISDTVVRLVGGVSNVLTSIHEVDVMAKTVVQLNVLWPSRGYGSYFGGFHYGGKTYVTGDWGVESQPQRMWWS